MNRNISIDILKGIGIIMVILGHFENIPETGAWIGSFHMPLFFIIAGYFFHAKDSFKKELFSSFKRLVLPYIFTIGLLILYSFIINVVWYNRPAPFFLTLWCGVFPTGTSFANSVPVWFLLALFWCRIAYFLMDKYVPRFAMFLGVLIGVVCIYLKNDIPFEVPFSIIQGFIALLFYTTGVIFARYNEFLHSLNVIVIVIWILFYKHCSVVMISGYFHNWLLAYICACGGTYAMYYISKSLNDCICCGKFLSWFGRNSLIVLCAHTIERYMPIPYPIMIQYTNVMAVLLIKLMICSFSVLICYRYKYMRFIFSI